MGVVVVEMAGVAALLLMLRVIVVVLLSSAHPIAARVLMTRLLRQSLILGPDDLWKARHLIPLFVKLLLPM